jgi:hypothetical protein
VCVFIDVLCTGRFLQRFLRFFPAPERVSVIALVDARDSGRSYLTMEGRDHSVDLPIISVLKDRVSPIKDRPAGISFRNVLLVDRSTHAPTRFPGTDRVGFDDLLLLRRADEAGALAAGHFSLKDHHYVYFLSFQRVFGELLVELQKWFDEQIAELTTTVGVEHLKVRTYCLDESTGLFQSLEHVLREKDFQPPKLLTREELFAPPVQPRIPNSTVWFVLPAMVSGITARSCLDFAEALGASTVQVSVVAARVDADVSRFYQGLQRYRDINTRFQFMFHVPLSSYLEGQCPACALRDSFRAVLDRIGIAGTICENCCNPQSTNWKLSQRRMRALSA